MSFAGGIIGGRVAPLGRVRDDYVQCTLVRGASRQFEVFWPASRGGYAGCRPHPLADALVPFQEFLMIHPRRVLLHRRSGQAGGVRLLPGMKPVVLRLEAEAIRLGGGVLRY